MYIKLGGFEQAGQSYGDFINHSPDFKGYPEKEKLLADITEFFVKLGLLKITR